MYNSFIGIERVKLDISRTISITPEGSQCVSAPLLIPQISSITKMKLHHRQSISINYIPIIKDIFLCQTSVTITRVVTHPTPTRCGIVGLLSPTLTSASCV